MMDEYEAQYSFWSSFGVPAFEENSVPTGEYYPDYPYITYEAVSSVQDTDVQVSASIWTRSSSPVQADTIANTIMQCLQNNGETRTHDSGMLWFTAETGFARNMSEPSDYMIKRKLLTVQIHFL